MITLAISGPTHLLSLGIGPAAMFANSTQKKLILAVLVSGALMAPAEAKGLKFHIAGTKIEVGNHGPMTVQTPGGKPVGVPIIPLAVGAPVAIPTAMVGAAAVSSVSDILSAPKKIAEAARGIPPIIDTWAEKFYSALVNFLDWFKGLVISYGLLVILGLAGTIFVSAITVAQIIGHHIRKGLSAAQTGGAV